MCVKQAYGKRPALPINKTAATPLSTPLHHLSLAEPDVSSQTCIFRGQPV